MAIDLVLTSLRRLPLFANLKPLQIAEIGRRAPRRAFRRGEVITEVGEPGDGAYLILSGDAVHRVAPGGPLEPIEPGSLIGELAMFVEHDYGTTVVAQGWVDCLKLERGTLHEQMRADPDIAESVADVIRERLKLAVVELQFIDRLLISSIEQCGEAPRALPSPVPPKPAAAAVALAQ